MNIKTVTVIGATGTMGANVAGIFASFGNANVYCVGRDISKVKATVPRIVKSVRADAIAGRLMPADFTMLEECVAKSDFVFESVAEDLTIKSEVAMRVGSALRASAIACTGTSGLSITSIASQYPEDLRSRFFGVHLFNPPYSMTLCELTATKWSDSQTRENLRKYLETVLYRTVVEVKDSPAFLGNRIGFQFINEALQYAERYKDNGGIDYIDAILGPFTGRAMAPLVTSDFVGLDIHKAIVDNIYGNTSDYAHETFTFPEFAQSLVDRGLLGRKTRGGLYRLVQHDSGLRRLTVYDLNADSYRDVIPYEFPFVRRMKKCLSEGDYREAIACLVANRSLEADICTAFLLKYIVYSLYAQNEVGYELSSSDDVMATGFNWCPPLAMIQAFELACDVPALVKERIPQVCELVDVEQLLADVGPSAYDYRPYFKSGR